MRQNINSVGKYELRAVLARTPLSTVYDGWDSDIARRVAIKMIPLSAGGDSDAAEALVRFKRGAQAAGKLNHPNIVAVYDYGEADGYAYLVMEFIDGPTLKAKFDENQRFGLSDIRVIFGGILDALQYSHDRGVVHRDIKPANIMFTQTNQVKITDFGIARLEDSEMTQAGMVIGTPAYMSPEQFLGEKIDAGTDIYSTGVVLYQILTGERPFEGNLATIMHKVLYGSPPLPSRISTIVTRSLDQVVTRAMARNREERFSSAAEFNAALQATLAPPAPRAERSPPSSARQVPPVRASAGAAPRPPVPKPASRAQPRAVLLASLVALGIVTAGVITWYGSSRRPAPPLQVAASAPVVQPPAAPPVQPQRVSQGPASGDIIRADMPAVTTPPEPPPSPSKQEAADTDQQDRVKAAISDFVRQPEPPITAKPIAEPPPRPPVPSNPSPPTSSQREAANTLPVPKKPPPVPPTKGSQISPAYGNGDRFGDAKGAKPAPEGTEDSSDAVLGRLRKVGGTPPPPSPPALRPPPTYAATSTSRVGLLCQTITAETAGNFGLESPTGMVVTGVVVGSAAYKAGIHRDDVILKIKGKDAPDLSVLSQVAAETDAGQTVPIEVLRHHARQTVQLQVDQLQVDQLRK